MSASFCSLSIHYNRNLQQECTMPRLMCSQPFRICVSDAHLHAAFMWMVERQFCILWTYQAVHHNKAKADPCQTTVCSAERCDAVLCRSCLLLMLITRHVSGFNVSQ